MVIDLCIGDVVGFGFLQTACYDCDWCFGGDEHLCNSKKTTCSRGGQGGFANKFKGDSRACFKIPDGLDLKTVGPLMCAGITVYSPLKKWSKPGCNVGVLGIGGLGHLAIKFAKAMGFTVTAFSRTSAKVEKYITRNKKFQLPSYSLIIVINLGREMRLFPLEQIRTLHLATEVNLNPSSTVWTF